MDDGDARLSFLGRPIGPGCVARAVVLPPGTARPYREDEWRDALVVVERGELEVEACCGDRRSFVAGAVLWLVGLPLVTLRNPAAEPLLLVAVSRRHPDAVTPLRPGSADPATPAARRTGTS
jgi:hypothetical protein